MQAQAQLQYEHIVVALNNSPRSIAFVRPSHLKPYVDIREGLTAIWDKRLVKIGEKEYDYNSWHPLEEGTELFLYFNSLLGNDYHLHQSIFM